MNGLPIASAAEDGSSDHDFGIFFLLIIECVKLHFFYCNVSGRGRRGIELVLIWIVDNE